MATSSSDSVFALGTTQLVIAAGATLALLVEAISRQNSIQLKYQSGGTVYVVGVEYGATLPASALDGAANHYLLGASEILTIAGPARFYLASLSATSIINKIIGRSSGP